MRNSNRAYDWSAAVSVGPFDLAPGASYHCAFAMLGGTSAANFEADADSAQSWYDHVLAVRENEGVSGARARVDLVCSPNPFGRNVSISFQVPAAGRVRVQVFDVTGRTVATLIDQDLAPSQVRADWTPGRLANGIYLLKVSQPDGTSTSKLMLLR
jgi:hypothetical protein